MTGKMAIIFIGVVGSLVVAALYLGLEPGRLAVLTVCAGLATWHNRKQRARDSGFWAIVWQLRQSSIEERSRMLDELEPAKLRDRVRDVLARDGNNEAIGHIERFPFPCAIRRSTTRAYWLMWGLGITMLVTALVPGPIWLRGFPLALAVGCVYGVWLAAQHERTYESVIEVTPLRVSELFPDGRVHTIVFGRHVELRHEPTLQRLRLTSGNHDPGIVLDYRRMGFDRLIELIAQYGGFRTDEPGTPDIER